MAPQFTQPRAIPPPRRSSSTASSSPPHPNRPFTVKRNLDEEEEGRNIAGSRWKIKGLSSTSKVVPIKLPVSPSTGHKSFSSSPSQPNPSDSSHRHRDSTSLQGGGAGEGQGSKDFYRYQGSSPSQSSSQSSSSSSSHWQHARVQVPGGASPCLSLAQLPFQRHQAPPQQPLPHRQMVRRAVSESSEEDHPKKSRTLLPSDESDHDHDFEIERRPFADSDDGDDDDDDDDDSSVKVEVGGYTSIKKPSRKSSQQSNTDTSRRGGGGHHRYIDLGNITLDCD
jgi:hypothetical protein